MFDWILNMSLIKVGPTRTGPEWKKYKLIYFLNRNFDKRIKISTKLGFCFFTSNLTDTENILTNRYNQDIASTQITNSEIFPFIAVLKSNVLFTNRKRNETFLKK